MSGASPVTRSCPNCGAPTDPILDPFTGEAGHLDNFAEVEDYLREHGSLSTDAYDLYADNHTRQEYENALAETNRKPRDGPFITDSIVCTETWCTADDCDFSRCTYTPPNNRRSAGVLN